MSPRDREAARARVVLAAIGVFRTNVVDKLVAPRQPGLVPDNEGQVELYPEYHAALAGLEHFDRVWLITWLDRASGWRPVVTPPRAEEPVGLFATRAPHRPNRIGLSAVRVLRVEPGVVVVRGHDVLDGTPILDLKPYLPYADADPDAATGWVDAAESRPYVIDWEPDARARVEWLLQRGVEVKPAVEAVLSLRPHPEPSHRVRELDSPSGQRGLEFAYRMWRIVYRCHDDSRRVEILTVRSGRENDEPWAKNGALEHPADRAEVHRRFRERFDSAGGGADPRDSIDDFLPGDAKRMNRGPCGVPPTSADPGLPRSGEV